jgi:hypothetical protein
LCDNSKTFVDDAVSAQPALAGVLIGIGDDQLTTFDVITFSPAEDKKTNALENLERINEIIEK